METISMKIHFNGLRFAFTIHDTFHRVKSDPVSACWVFENKLYFLEDRGNNFSKDAGYNTPRRIIYCMEDTFSKIPRGSNSSILKNHPHYVLCSTERNNLWTLNTGQVVTPHPTQCVWLIDDTPVARCTTTFTRWIRGLPNREITTPPEILPHIIGILMSSCIGFS